jgi:transposase
LDEFNESLVRRTIDDFYIVEKQRLTLRKVRENLRETLHIHGMHLHMKENYSETGVPLEHNHNIIQLPPYHLELNPNELIWATLKNWIAQNNTIFRVDDIIKLVDQKLASIIAEGWQRRGEHVRTIELQLMVRKGLLDAGLEFVFHVSSGSDDSSDDSSNSSGGDQERQICGDDIYADIAGVAPL